MFTVYLALVIFAEMGTTPPKIVGVFKTLDECFAAADSRNRPVGETWPALGTGYICLQMRAPL